jgi:hypothetical protein
MTGRFGAPQILFINEIGFLRHRQVLIEGRPGIYLGCHWDWIFSFSLSVRASEPTVLDDSPGF